MAKWSNVQLRNTIQWTGLELQDSESHGDMVERLLANGFEVPDAEQQLSLTQELKAAQEAEWAEHMASEHRMASVKAAEKEDVSRELALAGGGESPTARTLNALCVCALLGDGTSGLRSCLCNVHVPAAAAGEGGSTGAPDGPAQRMGRMRRASVTVVAPQDTEDTPPVYIGRTV